MYDENGASEQNGQSRFTGRKIAVLGCGKIGEALVRGMLQSGFAQPGQVHASVRRPKRAEYLHQTFAIASAVGNGAVARAAEVVVLAVKPNLVLPVLTEIAGDLAPGTLVISVAASVSTLQIERHHGVAMPPLAVVRAMPNTPALIGQGMTALACGQHVSAEHLALARGLFSSVGRTVIVEERHMDAVTGLSASGPAFIYMVVESLAEGGVRVGLPRELALELAAQTVVGAGAMVLATGEHPAKLKDAVTTPAGCTVDGLLELEEGGLRVALIKAVSRAALRAGQLAGAAGIAH